MTLDARYPAICDLRDRARRRIPHFVWEYLDSATGDEAGKRRNRAALDAVTLLPSILHGELDIDLSTGLLGQTYSLPVGIAPVGMSGLIWPNAEQHLVRAAGTLNVPYTLSTVLTVDVPVASRRERQLRSGLQQPPKLTPRLFAQVCMRPAWALGTARLGMPRMRLMDEYAARVAGPTEGLSSTAHVGYLLRTSPDWGYLTWLRDHWDGALVVKGCLDPGDVPALEAAGVDALWVSNHAARQFAGGPAPIDVLPQFRAATQLPLIFDSGIEGGLDILRAIALGADFVMLGRAWHYALGALGADGPAHLANILRRDLEANMGQLGIARLADTKTRLHRP